MDRAIDKKQSFDDFKVEVDKLAKEWNKKWNKLVGGRIRNDKSSCTTG